ncbi:uncharacterized protein LOC131884972 isoform X2 [Tigriopus californicus]|uniref:uncharacterized protein LOC131884972 isoform X2 n=1 Tax=Tigriopus californicus TaxID=6832 RepID=UPI0027DA02A5|nr:uncharacterized protein LOC131884972 isoform X2 [Tigriopus californicus]
MSHVVAAHENDDLPLLSRAQNIDHSTTTIPTSTTTSTTTTTAEVVDASRSGCGDGSRQLVLTPTVLDDHGNMLNLSNPDFLPPDPDLLSPSIGSSHGSLRQRRKSPVTVQEWVASLPPPHVLQRQNFVSTDLEDNHVLMGSTVNGGLGTSSNCTNGGVDLQVKGQLASGEPQFTAQTLQKENEQQYGESSASAKDESHQYDNDHPHNKDDFALLESSLDGPTAQMENAADDLKLGAEAEPSPLQLLRPLPSSSLSSPSSSLYPHDLLSHVHESIPMSENGRHHHHHLHRHGHHENEDVGPRSRDFGPGLKSRETSSTRVKGHGPSGNANDTLEARRRIFLQSHDHHSFQSDISAFTVSSVDSVLLSREVDPSELLMDLGFGGQSLDLLARIPLRFFGPSRARGICVEDFLRKQEELAEKFDSGFDGYRGLNGSSSTRPSELVEKIIDKIRSQERLLRRQPTYLSCRSSQWASSASLNLPPGLASAMFSYSSHHNQFAIPKASSNNGFASIVGHAQHHQLAFKRQMQPPLRGVKAFRAMAHSVLSPANRQFIEDQQEKSEKPPEDRTLVIGNNTFRVDEDLKVIEEEDEIPEDDAMCRKSDVSGVELRSWPKLGLLTKRDSTLSIQSSCSVDSDWSDEEMEEIEKQLEDIQEMSQALDKQLLDEGEASEARAKATERWHRLRRARHVAITRVKLAKRAQAACQALDDKSVKEEDGDQPQDPSQEESEPIPAEQSMDPESQPITPSPPVRPIPPRESHQLQRQMTHRQQLITASLLQSDHRIPRRFSSQYQYQHQYQYQYPY